MCDHSCRGYIKLYSHKITHTEPLACTAKLGPCPRSFAGPSDGPVHRDDGRRWLRTHRQSTVLNEAAWHVETKNVRIWCSFRQFLMVPEIVQFTPSDSSSDDDDECIVTVFVMWSTQC